MTPYEQGFLTKCAEYGVDGRRFLKYANPVNLALASSGPTPAPVGKKQDATSRWMADTARRANASKTSTEDFMEHNKWWNEQERLRVQRLGHSLDSHRKALLNPFTYVKALFGVYPK